MADDLWDFDAGWNEADAKPLRIRFLGREWELPADAPADAVLMMDRAMAAVGSGDEQAAAAILEQGGLSIEGLARKFVGDGIVDQWLALKPGSRQLAMVVRQLTDYYRGSERPGQPDEDAAPNREARRAAAAQERKKPAAKSRSSSATGRR
jgi:hypothetical protein